MHHILPAYCSWIALLYYYLLLWLNILLNIVWSASQQVLHSLCPPNSHCSPPPAAHLHDPLPAAHLHDPPPPRSSPPRPPPPPQLTSTTPDPRSSPPRPPPPAAHLHDEGSVGPVVGLVASSVDGLARAGRHPGGRRARGPDGPGPTALAGLDVAGTSLSSHLLENSGNIVYQCSVISFL